MLLFHLTLRNHQTKGRERTAFLYVDI